MTENNGSGKREDVNFDGVVDELRNVLSELGNVPAPAEAKPAPGGFDDPFSEAARQNPFPESRPEKVNGKSAGAAPASNGLASDADFWNGNVLGWPSNADADLPDVPSANGHSTEPIPSDNGFLREEPTADGGFGGMPIEPMPDPFMAGDAEKPPIGAEDLMPPVPQPIENTPEAWPLLKNANEVVPAAPVAPTPPPAPVAEAANPKPAPATPTADPWLHGGFGMDIEAAEPSLATKPAPVRAEETGAPAQAAFPPAADFELELPIPGTKETKDKPEPEAPPHLELDRTDMKPRDLVQIACIYPEGQEKAGQSFVSRLREAAEKLKAPITIQAVFVSGWTPDSVDPAAWSKSASLSGADVMFVLSFRASANLFRSLGSTPLKPGFKARLVLLEQTAFPTLYADILVELRRTR